MILLAYSHAADTGFDFVFRASDSSVKKVNVAGTFNGWNKDANPLTLESDGRTWTAKVHLPYGRVQYKFVLNGSQWVLDPKGPSVSDGNGNTNSEAIVSPPDYANPATPTDGITSLSALLHEPTEPQLNYDRGSLQIEFRARPNDLSQVNLLANGKAVSMAEVAHDDFFATYRANLAWDRK